MFLNGHLKPFWPNLPDSYLLCHPYPWPQPREALHTGHLPAFAPILPGSSAKMLPCFPGPLRGHPNCSAFPVSPVLPT